MARLDGVTRRNAQVAEALLTFEAAMDRNAAVLIMACRMREGSNTGDDEESA
jgi:hypothetical protein